MYIRTPLIRSVYFPQDVFLKLENTQPSGSFKSRGMTTLIESAVKGNSKSRVFSSSGGNAGLAAAEAAKGLGVPCTVVVPSTTKKRMIERIERLGAKVIVHGSMWVESDAYLRQLMEQSDHDGTTPIYCHPFDNPKLWEGHGTLVDEALSQIKEYGVDAPAAIALCCGGGGLYMGVIKALEARGLADKIPIVVVETEGAATFHTSVEAGEQIRLQEITTIATSLGSTYVAEPVIEYAKKYNSRSVLVTDAQAVRAIKQFASDHCMIVEPACAATLSAVYSNKLSEFADKGPVVVIVCGGTSWGSTDGY